LFDQIGLGFFAILSGIVSLSLVWWDFGLVVLAEKSSKLLSTRIIQQLISHPMNNTRLTGTANSSR